jgi:hypothetical protein
MKFTKQDAITFVLGALAAAAMVFVEAVSRTETEPISNFEDWVLKLGVGMAAALGRYVVTYLPKILGMGK